MRINENVVIYGKTITLVPYHREHVPKYYEWLCDEYILRTTATEPVTLEEAYERQSVLESSPEYAMFIILEGKVDADPEHQVASMVGDVSLIYDEAEQEGEVIVMIGEPNGRRKGFAIEAIKLLLTYAYDRMPLKRVFAKISQSNVPSTTLFRNKLKFPEVSFSEYFEEFTFALENDELKDYVSKLKEESFEIQEK